MPRGSTFFLFKHGIQPLWEDKENVGGGRFFINMKKEQLVNKVWEDLQIQFIIGDKETSKVNGVVMNVRTAEVILSVWTKEITAEE